MTHATGGAIQADGGATAARPASAGPPGFVGRRVIVMGLGRFGGGIGVTRWLCGQGARVRVTDLAPATDLEASVEALRGCDVDLRLGGHDEADLGDCDLLVVSPAVDKSRSAFFQAALRRGIAWTSEMNLFLERCRGRVVGITGSVGKSTTTAMIGAVLEAASRSPAWGGGQVWLGGNIGKSLLDDLPAIAAEDVVVLELSSFQLEDAAAVRRSPQVAVITNLRENHLDRHGTMAVYAAAKANIFRYQPEDAWAVVPIDGGLAGLIDLPAGPRLVRFGVDRSTQRAQIEFAPAAPGGATRRDELALSLAVPGLHNVHNAAAAVAVARILGAGEKQTVEALSKFPGLVHRLEFVAELGGVRYYNDSKATTPEAAMTSLRAFEGGVIMIVGGSEKGSSFVELGRLLAERARAVVCMGQTGPAIFQAVEGARGGAGRPPLYRAGDLDDAVAQARAAASPGDVVVLSPGCPSYDWFKNYEERGEAFKRIVRSRA
jgi:UDP-N-acetylmuramoylalanine--D-glutamate ligase